MASIVESGAITFGENRPLTFWRTWTDTWLGRVLLVAVSSTAIGLVFALPMWTMGRKQAFAQWWAWGIMTPLLAYADRNLPFSDRQFGRKALAHIPASVVLTSVYIYVFVALRVLIGDMNLGELSPDLMWAHQRGWLLWSMLIYWAIVGGQQAYRYYKSFVSSELQLQKMEKSYAQARLNALRMQLDPHFLFNALNTISSHVERDPRLTRRMIEHLGDLLRMSLESKDKQEVALAEELLFLDHYLEIQKIRFGDQLRIEIDIAPEVRYAQVPSLFLQPLVENAIRHGISRRASGGTVTVTAKPVGTRLEISVSDDGVGLPLVWSLEKNSGLGLSVTRERLLGLYPDGQSQMRVTRRVGGGTSVEIQLPLRGGEEINDRN